MSKLFSSVDNDDDSHKVAIVDYLAPPTTKQGAPTGARDHDDYYADDMYEGDSECIDGIGDSSHSSKNQVQDPELPIERQLEVVDMNNEDMDMLEWIVRKTIPIPKQYYWETGNTDLPRNVKVWHNVVGSLSHAVKWLDRVGKPVVDATGLTASRFDYVESTMTDKQKEMAIQTASARRLNCPNNNNKTSTRSSLSYPDKDGAFA